MYHPLRAPTGHTLLDHFIITSDLLPTGFPGAKLVICGGFNQLEAKELQDQLHLKQFMTFPMHANNTVYLILIDLTGSYLTRAIPP